jgi:histidinol phosphatase-like PHP family hydrolase
MEGSAMDAALGMEAALDRVAVLGMNAFAITDHGDMAAVPRFVAACAARGIKPIIGMEAYFVEDAAENIRKRVNDRYHLTLLALDKNGYANLLALTSRSWSENCLMQKLGLVDWRLLEDYHEGLICLSGCLAGPLAWNFHKKRPEEAERFHARFADLFGDRFQIELFNHGSPEEKIAVEGLLDLARRHDRPLVLTNDCHYLDAENWILHDTLIKTRFGKPTDFALPYHEFHLKSPRAMRELGFDEAVCDRTLEIAERITLTIDEIAEVSQRNDGAVEEVFLPKRGVIGIGKAVEKAAGVLGFSAREQRTIASLDVPTLETDYPEVIRIARGIEQLPSAPEPDLDRVARGSGLAGRVPLRRKEKILFAMWDEAECRAAGLEVIPTAEATAMVAPARATDAYLRGLAEFRRRKLERAGRLFAEALEADPGFTNARYQLALAHHYDRDHETAARLLEEVRATEPDFERLPHLDSYLGWARYELEEDEAARIAFERSLADKEIPGSLLGLGLVLERMGRFAQARTKLLRFVEIAPDDGRSAKAQDALERLASQPA